MAANVRPIWIIKGDVSSDGLTGGGGATPAMAPTLTTAAADFTGVSANNKCVFVADATNGGRIELLRFKAIGSNVPTCARIYFNNGQAATVATNNSFWGEQSLPTSSIATNSATAGIEIDYVLRKALPPGFRVFVGLSVTVAAGWVVTPEGGKF